MIKIAILDLYEGVANQGMRCLREILGRHAHEHCLQFQVDEFDVRLKAELPSLDYDLYISSGGPGDPLSVSQNDWEARYFTWLDRLDQWNADPGKTQKKYVFFICHSFQLACRHYNIASVCKRKSTSFGVFPIHMVGSAAASDPVFNAIVDPFYAVDSRDYQVIEPNYPVLENLGAKILCIEKERPHVAFERAIMAIRFNSYAIGTQFHPEADAVGMSLYLQIPERKKIVVDNHGAEKWSSMIEHLNDPDKILHTQRHILPNFLNTAIRQVKI